MGTRYTIQYQGISTTQMSATAKAAIVTGSAFATNFSLLGWFRLSAAGADGPIYNIATLVDSAGQDLINIRLHPILNQYRIYFHNSAATEVIINTSSTGKGVAGELVLWALTCTAGVFQFMLRRESAAVATSGTTNLSAWAVNDIASFAQGYRSGPDQRAAVGDYYGVYLRNHAITTTDLDALWTAANPAQTVAMSSGNFNGFTGIRWAYDHGSTVAPIYTGASAGSSESATPGKGVVDRLLIYDVGGPNAAGTDTPWVTYRVCTVGRASVEGPFFCSWLAPLRTGTQVLAVTAPPGSVSANVAGGDERLRRLALDRPDRAMRISSHGNSRAAWYGSAEVNGYGPTTFLSGFWTLRPNTLLGVDLAQITTSNVTQGPFDVREGIKSSTSPIATSSGFTHKTLSRYLWGSTGGGGVGPGAMVEIASGKTLRYLARPDWGMLKINVPITVRFRYFKWPLGGAFRIRSARDAAQVQTPVETYGDWSGWTETATTAAYTRALTAGEASSYNAGTKSIVLEGTGLGVSAGMIACRSTTYDVANVATVVEGGGNTTVTFDFAWAASPAEGNTIVFGAWDYAHVDIEHDAVSDGSAASWRGFEVEASNATTYGAMSCGVGAWASGADFRGFIYVPQGAGGTNFPNQTGTLNVTGPTGTASGPRQRWLTEIVDPDVSIVATDFTAQGYADVITLLQAAGASVVGWSEADFTVLAGGTEYATEANHLRTACIGASVPYISTYPVMGRLIDTVSAGEMYDSFAHPSAAFWARVVRAGIPMLQTATAGVAIGSEPYPYLPATIGDSMREDFSSGAVTLTGSQQDGLTITPAKVADRLVVTVSADAGNAADTVIEIVGRKTANGIVDQLFVTGSTGQPNLHPGEVRSITLVAKDDWPFRSFVVRATGTAEDEVTIEAFC